MSLLKFKVSWEEDDATFRNIEIVSSQNFYELHTCIKTAFLLPADMEASFFVSNDKWLREKEISSTVEKNLRDAPALSMKRTPLGALVIQPDQRFIYDCLHVKKWCFHLEIASLKPVPEIMKNYPICVKSEGVSPSQFGITGREKDAVLEIEEKYDLAGDEEGFGDEGDDTDSATEDQDTGANDNYTDEI